MALHRLGREEEAIDILEEAEAKFAKLGSAAERAACLQNTAIAEATESVEQVSLSASGITGNAERLASTSRDTAASIVEMDASIGEIASHMDDLAGAIDTTSAATTQVTDNIDQVVSGVGTLQTATGDVAERLADVAGTEDPERRRGQRFDEHGHLSAAEQS